jgi:hypothetical protein
MVEFYAVEAVFAERDNHVRHYRGLDRDVPLYILWPTHWTQVGDKLATHPRLEMGFRVNMTVRLALVAVRAARGLELDHVAVRSYVALWS